jgi:hypothetical protein
MAAISHLGKSAKSPMGFTDLGQKGFANIVRILSGLAICESPDGINERNTYACAGAILGQPDNVIVDQGIGDDHCQCLCGARICRHTLHENSANQKFYLVTLVELAKL